MFEYKKGNKVRCKNFHKGPFSFLNVYEGTEYKIEEIWQIAGSGDPIFKPGYIMIRINGVDFKGTETFYRYFFSKKEIRKLKLNKIQKNV